MSDRITKKQWIAALKEEVWLATMGMRDELSKIKDAKGPYYSQRRKILKENIRLTRQTIMNTWDPTV